MHKIKIKNFVLEEYSKPFVVAEAGINHNGSLKNALKMIDVAKNSGCQAIKFQTYKADELVQDKNLKFSYKSKGKIVTETMYKMFKRYEMNEEHWNTISDYCKKKKNNFFFYPSKLLGFKNFT